MSTGKGALPFAIAHDSAKSLVEQVETGLKSAIARGYFRAGELLPSTQALADELGVSRIVTRGAYRRLTEQGLIDPRVGVGCRVRERGRTSWRGQVLAIVPEGDDNFFQNLVLGGLRRGLNREGYLLDQLVITGGRGTGDFDATPLDLRLVQGVDFICTFYDYPKFHRYLAERKVPFASIQGEAKPPEGAVGMIRFDYAKAAGAFVDYCRERGIRSVVEFWWDDYMVDVVPALRDAGIAAESVRLEVDASEGRSTGVAEEMVKTATERLSRCRNLPDLIFLQDDHMTSSLLHVLAANDIRVPEEVQVVTWANRYDRPVYLSPLPRMEVDPLAAAAMVTDAVMAYLRTGTFPGGLVFGPAWIV